MKLGKREIDALACPPNRQDALFFDDAVNGFAVRVTRAGTKVYIFQYRRAGRVWRMRLGAYGDMTPDQARRRATHLRGLVAGGSHPAAEVRQQLRAEAEAKRASALTCAVLLDRWLTEGLRDRRPNYKREAGRAIRTNLPGAMGKPAAEIDAAQARKLIGEVSSSRGAVMARRTLAYARACFSWAVKRGEVAANPFSAVAVDGREQPRDRVLSNAELGEVWRAAGRMGWPWGPFVRFAILTLQRESEVAGLHWAEIDQDLSVWTLPAERAKNGRKHLVALPDAARQILRSAPRMTVGRPPAPSPLVFTTTGQTPVSGFSKAKARLDSEIAHERASRAAAAGVRPDPLVPWRLHDLRRTGVTVMARMGVRWEVADRVLNHVSGRISGVAAVYQQHDYAEERAAALRDWAARVLTLAQDFPAGAGPEAAPQPRQSRRRSGNHRGTGAVAATSSCRTSAVMSQSATAGTNPADVNPVEVAGPKRQGSQP